MIPFILIAVLAPIAVTAFILAVREMERAHRIQSTESDE